ncbi:MAG: Uma2 family endonuclease [Chloroflexi bacterium HGW-Chloroflexi-1]|nr:MAG: Uma2 family endonuclease [Chloroflexi bacterium HGW-Chloroflexi-1]
MFGTNPAVKTIRPPVWTPLGGRWVPGVPPLEPGDRLTRYEFERRYAAMAHVKKAELIEGVVYMPSPVSNAHSEAHGDLMAWLGIYRAATCGVHLNDNATVRLDLANEVQPDALLRLDVALEGASRIGRDGYIEGAPELIAEIAVSSVSYDLHDKLCVYQRSGVPEYLVWQVDDRRVDWFRLREGQYVPLTADSQGVVRSEVFPGLQLAVPALLEGDLATVLAVLQQGCQSAEHAAYVARLAVAA